MASRGSNIWRRPYTSIYNDNYKYGTGLYSDTLTDIEKRYSDSLSKTQLRSDRRDLNFSTFADSTLTGSPTPAGSAVRESSLERPMISRQRSVPSPSGSDMIRNSSFNSRLNATLSSSYDLDDEVQEVINNRREKRMQKMMSKSAADESVLPPRPKSLYDDAAFWTLPKTTEDFSLDMDTKSKKKIGGGGSTTTNGPRASQWREKSRVLEDQVESLDRKLSDCSGKLNNELSTLKSKYSNQITDLHKSIDVTSDQTSDMQKLCKRQALQLLELQSAYDDSQRNIQDALEEMSLWRNRCKSLKKDMDKLREEVELAVHRTTKE